MSLQKKMKFSVKNFFSKCDQFPADFLWKTSFLVLCVDAMIISEIKLEESFPIETISKFELIRS